LLCSNPAYGARLGAVRRALFRAAKQDRAIASRLLTVQGIYRGWARFGFVLFGALLANLLLALSLRGCGSPFWLALAALLLIVATLVIFFIWIYPANQTTANWTSIPANWATLRRSWEYAHAANALLTFVALCCATLAALTARY
jgi:hypothetical protein